MNSKLAAVLAATIVTVTTAPAFAMQSGAVRLDDVRIQAASNTFNDFNYMGLVDIAFTNTGSVPIHEIVFGLHDSSGRLLARIKDVGNYAAGSAVRHRFNSTERDAHQQVAVEEVTFTDGTVWTNTDQPAPVTRRQSR
jgi:hypothetical protein